MDEVVLSLKPKWCSLIFDGQKTVEVRKSAPKRIPFKCLIYCTKDGKSSLRAEGECRDDNLSRGMIVGEFVCDKVDVALVHEADNALISAACVNRQDLTSYATGRNLKFWHVTRAVLYDEPMELGAVAPMSWAYKRSMWKRGNV